MNLFHWAVVTVHLLQCHVSPLAQTGKALSLKALLSHYTPAPSSVQTSINCLPSHFSPPRLHPPPPPPFFSLHSAFPSTFAVCLFVTSPVVQIEALSIFAQGPLDVVVNIPVQSNVNHFKAGFFESITMKDFAREYTEEHEALKTSSLPETKQVIALYPIPCTQMRTLALLT